MVVFLSDINQGYLTVLAPVEQTGAVQVREEVITLNRKYETVFVLDPKLEEEGINATTEKIKNLVESSGTIDHFEEWGSRRLAYEINDQRDGFYFLMHFTSDVNFPAEFERKLKITDGVMRFLVVRLED